MDVQLLMDLEHIDLYKLIFNKTKLKGYVLLTVKEYWNGVVTTSDTLIPAAYAKKFSALEQVADSSTVLALITKPVNDSVLFHFKFGQINLTKKYRKMNTGDYTLRDGCGTGEMFKKIPVNQTIPLFAYSLPYEDPKTPGRKSYCALTADSVSPAQWWNTYRIPHYIVVEMIIIKDS